MAYINWYEVMLWSVFDTQVLANYAMVVNGAVEMKPQNPKAHRLIVMNNSSSPLYMGADASVNDMNGFPIFPGDMVAFNFYTEFSFYLYGNNQEIRVLELA